MLRDPEPTRADVVIIGAGVAGLVAAGALRRAGLRTVVLEARERIGGRVEGMAGTGTDLGPAWFWPHHAHMTRLVATLGLGVFEQPTAGDAVWDAGGGRDPVRVPGGGAEAPSYRLAGGMSALVHALAADAGPVRLGARVEQIAQAADGVRVAVAGDPDPVAARACVVALPPALAAQTLAFSPPLGAERSRRMASVATWMSWSMKVALVYPEPTWRARGLSGLGLSQAGLVSQFFDASEPGDAAPGDAALHSAAPGVLVGWVDPARAQRMTAEGRRAEASAQASRLFGLGPPAAYAERDWSAERFTSGAGASADGVGLFGHARLRDALWDGRLHLGGSETAAEHPGYLDGAVARGESVARAVARRLAGGDGS